MTSLLREYDEHLGVYNQYKITLINKMVRTAIDMGDFSKAEELSRRLVDMYERIL